MDRDELAKRGKLPRTTTIKNHPYFRLEWRVIDNPAFADLTPSAVKVLLLICRQLTKDNNGHLQATYTFMKKHGIGSEHTLQEAIRQLISHGFIYRTRSHGANRAWARYAVTWLSITKKEGLFLAGFVSCGWRYWEPVEKKAPRKKSRSVPAKSADLPPEFQQEVQESVPQEMQTMNSMPDTVTDIGEQGGEMTEREASVVESGCTVYSIFGLARRPSRNRRFRG